MPGPVFLAGDRVTLRPAERDDVDFLLENRNDPEVRAGRTAQYPSGHDDVETFLGGTMGRNDESLGLLVCVDEQPVGYVLINRERMGDSAYDRGELAYWITPAEWGNGYATEASRVLLDHSFDGLGLRKVVARAFASNEGSQRVIEKLGFTREGTFREEAYVDGAWEDYYRYGLLREEWRESRSE